MLDVINILLNVVIVVGLGTLMLAILVPRLFYYVTAWKRRKVKKHIRGTQS